jgi:hypothetical protein
MLRLWLAAGVAVALAGCVVGPGYGPGYGAGYGYYDQGGVYDAAPGYAPAYGAVGTVDIAVGGRRDYGDSRRVRTQSDDHRGRGPNQPQPGYVQRGPGTPAGNGAAQNRQGAQGASSRWRVAQDSQGGGGNGYVR